MRIFYLIILFTGATWAVSTGPAVYVPDTKLNAELSNTMQMSEPMGPHSETINPKPVKAGYLPTGSQTDIDKFNKKIEDDPNVAKGLAPQPFSDRTNSYWLNPNFQFGPGSVNDFGGDPNAEQMLQPFYD